jgi:hypothetical protein
MKALILKTQMSVTDVVAEKVLEYKEINNALSNTSRRNIKDKRLG